MSNPRALSRFRVTAEGADEFFHAAIVITCRRCDHSETVSNEDFEAGLDDLVVWAQDHRCLAVRTVTGRQAAALAGVA